jgi:hypothetical protein
MKDTPQRDNLNATPKPLSDLFVMQKAMTARRGVEHGSLEQPL